jgi:hypothetical protein
MPFSRMLSCDEHRLKPPSRGFLQRLAPNELEQAFRPHAKSLPSSCAAASSRFIAVDQRVILAHETLSESHSGYPWQIRCREGPTISVAVHNALNLNRHVSQSQPKAKSRQGDSMKTSE